MSMMPLIQTIPFLQPTPTSYRQYAGYNQSHPHGISAVRKFAQGAGSALLMFAGANTMTSGAEAAATGAPPMVDFTSFDGIAQSLVSGGLTGPVQIFAAAVLFLAAGKCIARFAGLAIAAAVVILYLQGVTPDDAWQFADRFLERSAAAVSAFQTAEVG